MSLHLFPEKTRLAVFDIDGTLTDSAHDYNLAYFDALLPFAFKEIDTNWGDYKHHTDTWIFSTIFEANHNRQPQVHEHGRFTEEIEKVFAEAVKKKPVVEIEGAAEFIRFLAQETPWAVAFATGSLRQPARAKLSSAQIYFEENILATSTEHDTREQIVTSAITLAKKFYAQEDFEIIVSFGDGLWDMKTANALNLPFIGIGKGPKADHLANLGQTVFENFQNLKTILDQMNTLYAYKK